MLLSFPRLDKKTLLNNIQKSLTVSLEYVRWTDKYPYILLDSLEYLIMIGQLRSNILYAKLYTLISLPVLLLLTETLLLIIKNKSYFEILINIIIAYKQY